MRVEGDPKEVGKETNTEPAELVEKFPKGVVKGNKYRAAGLVEKFPNGVVKGNTIPSGSALRVIPFKKSVKPAHGAVT